MDDVLITIASGGFMVAILHAALPTHWLPFVLAGRAQQWSRARTITIVMVAGGAHVVFTTLLGGIIIGLGSAMSEQVGHVFIWLASGILLSFGITYIWRQARGAGHEHHHSIAQLWQPKVGDHQSDRPVQATDKHPSRTSDRVAIGGLFSMLTFSPCESFLPVYLSGARYGWTGFILLSVVLAVATLGGMMILTWVAHIGLSRIRIGFIEHYENGIVGGLLCALGLLVLFLEH